jgi:hypothetical protein
VSTHPPANLPACLLACTYINIKGLMVKIPTKIPAIVFQSWLDKDFCIIRFHYTWVIPPARIVPLSIETDFPIWQAD